MVAPGLRWGWTFLAGSLAAALTWFLTPLSVFVYAYLSMLATGQSVSRENILAFAQVGAFALPVVQALLVLIPTRILVAGRVSERHVLHGVVVGVVSGVVGQAIGLYFGPFRWDQGLRYLVLAVAGGWLGGLWGRASQKRQEALLRTSRAVGLAETPQEVARCIGENMPDAQEVSLWRTEFPGDPADSGLLAFWSLKSLSLLRKSPGLGAEDNWRKHHGGTKQ